VVCLSVTTVSPANMAEPIKMPFEMWTQMGPRNQIPMEMGNFEGDYHPCAVVMWPFVKLL